MTDDIVKRLRMWPVGAELEAADEIERLRVELRCAHQAADDVYKRLMPEIERLREEVLRWVRFNHDDADEIDRLRAALWEVANADFLDFSLAPERSASTIARAALAGEKPSD